MKRKTLTLVVGLLLTLSLIGVGFASWVISANDSEQIIGNVGVQTVADRRLDITVKELTYDTDHYVAGDANKIIFGMPTEDEITAAGISNPWLTNVDDTVENLAVTFIVEVAYKQAAEISADDITFAASYVENSAITGLVTAGYLAQPSVTYVEETESEPNKVTYKVTLSFDWGTDFEGINPYLYYNAAGKTAKTHGDVAWEAMNVVNSISDLTYTVKIDVDKA